MARRSRSAAVRGRPIGKREDNKAGTRQTLVEAAGPVFAEQGYEGATAKEICRRAGVNAAAINYHFGGIEPLYTAVLGEAQQRIFSAQAIARAVEGKWDPEEQLEAALGVVLGRLLSPAASSWAVRLVGRDLIAPSPTAYTRKQKFAVPRANLVRRLIGRLMNRPEHDAAVDAACFSVMAPVCTLILADHRMLRAALPALELSTRESQALTRRLVRFALAGLRAAPR